MTTDSSSAANALSRGPATPVDWGLRNERGFCGAFGGYSLEIPGGYLVVNEKVPVARFNHVQDVRTSPGRVLAFVERALEHYFQRALRPTFEIPDSVEQPLLLRALERAGYRHLGPAQERRLLWWDPEGTERGGPPSRSLEVEVMGPDSDLDLLARFWMREREREEIVRSLDVALSHPNPGEEIRPYLAREQGVPVATAMIYRYRGTAGLHSVAILPSARARGLGTSLVHWILEDWVRSGGGPLTMWIERDRVPGPLRSLGFREVARYRVYALVEESARRTEIRPRERP
jgi:GNAT superfamily N-acetyltransferase